MPRPPHWKAGAPNVSFTPSLSSLPALPRLPVLPLSPTLSALKRSLHPLARDQAEYDAASKKIDDFGKAGGLGEVLQQRLEERERKGVEGSDGGTASGSWLEEWWDDGAYLAYRDSVVVYVSYYYGFTPAPSHLPSRPSHRAASIARSALLFRQQLYAGQLSPDRVKEGVLDMDTYRWMFDCSRVPAMPSDWSVSYASQYAAAGKPGHIVVIRNNRFWKVHVDDGKGGLISTEDLENQIKCIYENSAELYPAVGILSASNRDIWTTDYAALLATSPTNADILREIHSSAFVLCLDTERPEGKIEFSRACWHAGVEGGMGGNRWFDKPCQFIVFDNGEAGFMGEHSVMDGTPTVRLCDHAIRALHSPSFHHGTPSSPTLPPPTPLDFTLNSDLHTAISNATTALHSLVSAQALSYTLTPYGKALPKKHSLSPDSWAQMIIQLAYHRLFPSSPPGATYESATTRRFARGRTETIRTVCDESKAWVEAMDDKRVGGKEKREAFRRACGRHIELARAAGMAKGVDRHLFGLKHLLQPSDPAPPLFSDPLFQRSAHWNLSTSAIFSEHFPAYGWGAVVPDGFGVAYMTGYEDRFQFTITSRAEMPNAEFCAEIDRAAKDIADLFHDAEYEGRSKL